MDRRHFLRVLAGASAGFALDPERLLWTPGAKTIFLPPITRLLTTADVIDALKYTYGADKLAYLMSQECVLWNVLNRTRFTTPLVNEDAQRMALEVVA